MAERTPPGVWVLRILSAVFLLAAGVIHIYLVFNGTGGILGVLFILNGVAGIILAAAVLLLRGRLVRFAVILGLLYLIATLSALLLALTVGLFGIHSSWDLLLVPQTVVIESIGIVVLAVTTAAVLRPSFAAQPEG